MKIKDEELGRTFSTLMLTDAGWPQAATSTKKTWEARLVEWLRHPLILLLLSSAIIPSIVYLLAKQRDLIASRQHQALDIVSKNSIFEGELYALYSELGLFHQSNQKKSPKAEDLKTLQNDLDRSWTIHYLEFRKSYPDAHFWLDDLFGQGVILKLFSASDVKALLSVKDKEKLPASKLHDLADDIENYKGNLSESLGELRRFRDKCISSEYDFDKVGPTSQLQLAVTKRLNELRDERTRIITNMAEIFSR